MAITTIIKSVQEQRNGRAKLIAIFQGGPDGERVVELDVDAYATPEEADAVLRSVRSRQAERIPLAKLLPAGERDIDATELSATPEERVEAQAKLAYLIAKAKAITARASVAAGIANQEDADALVAEAKKLYRVEYAGL